MRWTFPVFFAVLTAGSAWLFHIRYWLYRDCIKAALSSCVTPDGDNLTPGRTVWGGFTFVFLLLALFTCRR